MQRTFVFVLCVAFLTSCASDITRSTLPTDKHSDAELVVHGWRLKGNDSAGSGSKHIVHYEYRSDSVFIGYDNGVAVNVGWYAVVKNRSYFSLDTVSVILHGETREVMSPKYEIRSIDASTMVLREVSGSGTILTFDQEIPPVQDDLERVRKGILGSWIATEMQGIALIKYDTTQYRMITTYNANGTWSYVSSHGDSIVDSRSGTYSVYKELSHLHDVYLFPIYGAGLFEPYVDKVSSDTLVTSMGEGIADGSVTTQVRTSSVK